VFTIIGAVIFGIYYFAVARPAAEGLERAKGLAFDEIRDLAAVGTSQALTAAAGYSAQVRVAGSTREVDEILVRVILTTSVERKRAELLRRIDTAANGVFYTVVNVPELAALSRGLKENVNAMMSKPQLEVFAPRIDTKATSTWRTLLARIIENIPDNRIEMWTTVSGKYISKDNALVHIAGGTWKTLRELKFEAASTVEVPVLDTFQRTPTIITGSIVNIYVYDIATDNMSKLWANARVRSVIYCQADIATIAWHLVDGPITRVYTTDMWETIKAAAAGSPFALAVGWLKYGTDVMDRARRAQLGKYDVSVIYMVEVPDKIGERILQYELHMAAAKDVILVATV
jgi:hypothetical protein